MPEQHPHSDSETAPPSPLRRRFSLWRILNKLFEALQWLSERTVSLLRLLVTLAMFSVVTFIIYNAYASRNTVVVKPFQVPVSVGRENHEHAGRIIANQLNRHLLETQNNLRDQLNITIDQPVPDEESVLIEGESIKLPETGITIDNVIEFISGIFGRKNLSGAVYFEPDLEDNSKEKLYLQLSLRGRIISLSEDELGAVLRTSLPPTQRNGLNIQLISAMLKARSKEIISIASEDYNLYYYCTRDVGSIEHKEGQYDEFFKYCQRLQDGNATPDTLETLKKTLTQTGYASDNQTILGSVIQYINDEINRKQLTLCQSKTNQSNQLCQKITVAETSPRLKDPGSALSTLSGAPIARFSFNSAPAMLNSAVVAPAPAAVDITSLQALTNKCEQKQSDRSSVDSNRVAALEQFCFSPQKQQALISGSEALLQSNKYQEDAKQQYHNGAFEIAAENYQQSISLNCNNYVAWGNLGILLSKASKESAMRDVRQGQCALLRAVQINSEKFWLWHSLCAAQMLQAEDNLERFLNYESCQIASTINPGTKTLNERLFYIEAGDKYVELEKYEQAAAAYIQSMNQENTRSRSMQQVVSALIQLEEKGVEGAKAQACRIYNSSTGTGDKEQREAYEIELDNLAAAQGCLSL
jgi:tetratricopeptide (TPR) repeat protein